MRLGVYDSGDDEAFELRRRIIDVLDFEADARERLDDLGERRRRVEVILEPGGGEFQEDALRSCFQKNNNRQVLFPVSRYFVEAGDRNSSLISKRPYLLESMWVWAGIVICTVTLLL
jgi:hypothetical protein